MTLKRILLTTLLALVGLARESGALVCPLSARPTPSLPLVKREELTRKRRELRRRVFKVKRRLESERSAFLGANLSPETAGDRSMDMEMCPSCRTMQNMRMTSTTRTVTGADGNPRTVCTVSYHCESCGAFVRSEDAEIDTRRTIGRGASAIPQ